MLYGRLSFNGYGQEESRNVKYMIADTSRQKNDDKENIKSAIFNEVGNKLIERVASKAWRQVLSDSVVPKLVISVTGGARDFKMPERHLEAFKRGLIKAATTTETWIVTGGTQNGVMQVVGDAVRDYMLEDGAYKQALVVVGIATLGVIAHADDLVRHAGKTGDIQQCYTYHNPVMLEKIANEKNNEKKSFQISLDPHHTHFVLVDDGSKNQFGREINVRAAFEQHRDDTAEERKGGVPVVLLMLEGGINTLQTACEAIEAGTPVVIMQGSGRAADFVVNCSPLVKTGDMAKLKLAAEEWLVGDDVERGVKYVCTLLNPNYNDFLNLFMQSEDTSGDELAEVILKAILRASLHANSNETSKESAVKFLELSLSFNRCDIAKQEIHKNNLVVFLQFI